MEIKNERKQRIREMEKKEQVSKEKVMIIGGVRIIVGMISGNCSLYSKIGPL